MFTETGTAILLRLHVFQNLFCPAEQSTDYVSKVSFE